MPLPAAPSFDGIGPWPANTTVALACSGGADSTFLALQWLTFADSLGDEAPKAVVWVVDHGHRPETVDEAAQAKRIYLDLGFQVKVLRPAAPWPAGQSENQLRNLRYRLFAKQALADDVQVLMTAHHADDQAETVLLRILRGTGLRGLAGIRPRRQLMDGVKPGLEIRRPLLGWRSYQIREELQKRRQRWLEDPTNQISEIAARNRLRLELMPELSKIATGDPVEALLKLAADAAQWRDWLETGLEENSKWLENWKSLPEVLRREAVASQLRQAGCTVSRRRLSDLELALVQRGSAAVDEKLRLTVAGGKLQLVKRRDPQQRRN